MLFTIGLITVNLLRKKLNCVNSKALESARVMMMSLPTLSPYLDLSAACMCSVWVVHVHMQACMLHTNKYVLVFGRRIPLAVWL